MTVNCTFLGLVEMIIGYFGVELISFFAS